MEATDGTPPRHQRSSLDHTARVAEWSTAAATPTSPSPHEPCSLGLRWRPHRPPIGAPATPPEGRRHVAITMPTSVVLWWRWLLDPDDCSRVLASRQLCLRIRPISGEHAGGQGPARGIGLFSVAETQPPRTSRGRHSSAPQPTASWPEDQSRRRLCSSLENPALGYSSEARSRSIASRPSDIRTNTSTSVVAG